MPTIFKDICHGEPYTTRDGQDKKKWTKIGTLIEKEGKQYIKLAFMPVGTGEIFLSVFEQDQGSGHGFPASGGNKPKDPFASSPDFGDVPVDSDIPF